MTGRVRTSPEAPSQQIDATSMANPNRKSTAINKKPIKPIADAVGSLKNAIIPNRRDEVFSNPDSFSPDSKQNLGNMTFYSHI